MSMPRATAQQICLFALRKLGVVNRRMPVQVDDMQDALEALWFLLDSFSRSGAMIPFYSTVSCIVTDQGTQFTIGSGGDFNCDPPIDIQSVMVNSGGYIYAVDPMQGSAVYQALTPYANETNYPKFYNINKTYPSQTILFSGNLLEGDVVSITGTFPFSCTFTASPGSTDVSRTSPNSTQLALTEETEFPVGYQSMLMWCLADALLAEYPQDNQAVTMQINQEAALARSQIENSNAFGRHLTFTETNGYRNRYWGNICAPYQ